jgi:[protein-PII] uridylyltransferase
MVVMSIVVLGQDGTLKTDPTDIAEWESSLHDHLVVGRLPEKATLRSDSRRLRHFNIPTMVTFLDNVRNEATAIEVIARDRPGLLYQVAMGLYRSRVKLGNARISTLGERAEDIFFITDRDGDAITDEATRERIRENIIAAIDDEAPLTDG